MFIEVSCPLRMSMKSEFLRPASFYSHLSRLVGKPTMWFPNRSDTNRAVEAQKQARSLKFGLKRNCTIRVVKKTKALISFVITAKVICIFVFAYADCWFSHEAAHLYVYDKCIVDERFCFRYTDSTIPPLLKSEISS